MPRSERRDRTPQPPYATGRLEGTIERVIADRGFFFIRCDGLDYFGHFTGLMNGAQVADLIPKETRVSFEVGDRGKGPRAERIEIL